MLLSPAHRGDSFEVPILQEAACTMRNVDLAARTHFAARGSLTGKQVETKNHRAIAFLISQYKCRGQIIGQTAKDAGLLRILLALEPAGWEIIRAADPSAVRKEWDAFTNALHDGEVNW